MNIFSPKKCCFCFPLRKGLLCIGYLRLLTCLLTIVQFLLMCVSTWKRMEDSFDDAVTFLKSVACIVLQSLDLIFTLTFIVAARKKSSKLLEVYYFYCVTMVLVYSLVVVLNSWNMARFNLLYFMMFQYAWFIESSYFVYIGLGVFVILLQIYWTLLVRSEVHHLEESNNAELERQSSSISIRLPSLNSDK